MEISLTINEIISCIKKSITGTLDPKATVADKMLYSIYIDYFKKDILGDSEKARQIFKDLEHQPDDLKIEGKLELMLENVLENEDLFKKVAEKTHQLKQYFDQVKKTEDEKLVADKVESPKTEDELTKNSDDEDSNLMEDEDESFDDLYRLNEEGSILVPWDFSDIAEFALEHALQYSKKLKGEINLIHIIKKEKEREKAEEKLNERIKELTAITDVKINHIIKEGSIFTTITEVAQNTNAKLVVMATHGMKGFQKITGSWALKVIVDTKSPFVVVQAPPKDTIRKILFPVDHGKESREKLKQAELIAESFPGVLFEIMRTSKAPNQQFERLTNTNVNYAKSYFRQKNIHHTVVVVEGNNISEAISKYAPNSKADLIMILTTKNINIADYMVGPDEQKIIFNESKIPVMCINPRKGKYVGISGFGAMQ